MKIEVKAKMTAGTHPVHGPIIKGQAYTIEEGQFAPQLFERPSKDWQAPWERKAAKTNDSAGPAPAKKKGR